MAQAGSGLGSNEFKFQFSENLYEELIDKVTKTVIQLFEKNQGLGEDKLVMVLAVDKVTKLTAHIASHAGARILEKLEEKRKQEMQEQRAVLEAVFALALGNNDDEDSSENNVADHSTDVIKYPWKKEEQLGRGAFGFVFKARGKDGFQFAVKEVESAGKESVSLREEISCLTKLSHPHVVKCFGYAEGGGKIYMYLELLSGSITDRMDKANRSCNVIEARKLTVDIVLGLAYLHGKDIVHRDLKCANVLLDGAGRAKLGDMDLSRENLQKTVADYSDVGGSIMWMSPEVFSQKLVSKKTDIWSLGCTVYEMLKRTPPFADLGVLRFLFLQSLSSQGGCSRHREAIESDDTFQGDLENFLLRIFVPFEERPYIEGIARHPWLSRPNNAQKDPCIIS